MIIDTIIALLHDFNFPELGHRFIRLEFKVEWGLVNSLVNSFFS